MSGISPKPYSYISVGIRTGQVSGIFVLDVYVKDNGLAYWNDLQIHFQSKTRTPSREIDTFAVKSGLMMLFASV
jgi:hypothetical protein